MQKVEGSNPFSRFIHKKPVQAGFSFAQVRDGRLAEFGLRSHTACPSRRHAETNRELHTERSTNSRERHHQHKASFYRRLESKLQVEGCRRLVRCID